MLYYLHLNTFKLKLFPNTVSRLLTQKSTVARPQGSSIGYTGRTRYYKRTNENKEVSAVIFPHVPVNNAIETHMKSIN